MIKLFANWIKKYQQIYIVPGVSASLVLTYILGLGLVQSSAGLLVSRAVSNQPSPSTKLHSIPQIKISYL